MAEAAAVLGMKSRNSVYRKINSGELQTITGTDGKPLIERDGLEARWRQITRGQSNSPQPQPLAEPTSRRSRSKPTPAPTSPTVDAGDVPDFNEERARHEREKRLLAELARQEKEGELLRRDDVTTAWTQAVNLTRTKLLGVPSTVKQRIPHLEVEEIEVITGLIREALEELAGGEVAA